MVKRFVTVCVVVCSATLCRADAPGEGPSTNGAIIVTATRPNRNVYETPTVESPALDIATSVVEGDEITLRNAVTLTEALDFAPGVLTETRGRKVKQFTSFRGQRYPYPDYAVNGTWQKEFHELPYFFPAQQIERIEVIRSSAALLMGLSGQSGVINIVPKRFDEPLTRLEAEYGTFETFRTHVFRGGPLRKGGYAVGAGYYSTEGPTDMNAVERIGNLNATLDWNVSEKLLLEGNMFFIYGLRQLRRAEEPAASRLQVTDEKYDPVMSAIVNLRGVYRWNENTVTETMAYFTERAHDFVSTAGGHVSNDERDYEYGASVMQVVTPSPDNILRIGGLYSRWVAPNGKRFFAGRRCDVHTLSAVLVDEHGFGKLHVDAGIRYTRAFYDEYGAFNISGSSRKFGTVASIKDEWNEPAIRGSAGATYELAGNSKLYLNIGRGVIQPRSGTLNTAFEEPSNELRTTLDTGVKIGSDKTGWLSAGAFYSKRDDALILDGAIATNAQGVIMELYDNQDMVQYGLEVEARSPVILDIVTLFANATVMESRAKTNGSYENYRDLPDTIVSAGAYSRYGRLDCNLFAKYVSAFESKRFAGDGQYHPLGDFVSVNLTAGYRLGSEKNTRMYASIENLTDNRFSTVVGYPDFGRRYHLGLQHSF